MQNKNSRSNRERTEATRGALLAAARAAFIDKGYAATSTPAIVAAAGITRGALYHHFADKQDLFRAVLEEEARAVAAEIEAAAPNTRSARKALVAGSKAYLDAMTVPGRTRLLLIDGPAVLGSAEIFALDEAHAGRTLREGLEAALGDGPSPPVTVDALATLLSAAFDRAALAIDAGGDAVAIRAAMVRIVERALD
ncbi:TetR/AcrR family transcriptional regulator [Cupriavidus respiraculi]|uniref:TetR/AcrR family transcriptional regulator n=1 Tax=Cupriavidus respiraculi TaxID=195930 RepID=UPI001C9835A2|nr:TetR/AcrR family transcriptional regulator [Cupriavidus respiraculi]MBY4947357.1 TetR/AcrR family transcriptional regulator [Cupriavidus respiraculi]